MEDQKVFNIDGNVKEVTIRQGDAVKVYDPVAININGIIDSVSNWLQKRVATVDGNHEANAVFWQNSHILIDRENMNITLIIDEKSKFKGLVKGSLQLHPDFEKWNINTGVEVTARQLSEFVKMNRSCFTDASVAMKLASELQTMRVKVDKEIEKSDNNRGDVRAMLVQKVISNSIPENFTIDVPIFKGQDKKKIKVEIYVNPDMFSCSLISYEANDIVMQFKNTIIDEQKKLIKDIEPALVIIEV